MVSTLFLLKSTALVSSKLVTSYFFVALVNRASVISLSLVIMMGCYWSCDLILFGCMKNISSLFGLIQASHPMRMLVYHYDV